MKIFTKKRMKQRIISILITILLLQNVVPTESKAGGDGIGGILFSPIQTLILTLGDVGEMLLNISVDGTSKVTVTLSKDESVVDKVSDGIIDVVFGGGIVGDALGKVPVIGSIRKKGTGLIKKANKWVIKEAKSIIVGSKDFEKEIELPVLSVTPDKIFSNQIPLLDVNIIKPNKYTHIDSDGNEVEVTNTPVNVMQKTISSWYFVLRNIAIVAFLSMLVYIGIRIIISSVANEKAKYKQMLIDWIVGLCLLFSMHYIMSFVLYMTEEIIDLLDINNGDVIIKMDDLKLTDYNSDSSKVKNIVQYYNKDKDGSEVQTLSWRTDMAGYIRFLAQSNIKSNSIIVRMGFSILYLTLVIYTYLFMFQYLRRLLNLIFLTLIAPFVALAYPLDKIGDGKAQAFNMWLREYLTNLLIQPMHLILYTVLIGSAINLSTDHPIYAIIVFGFMLQAEKLIKKMFRLNNADTVQNASGGAFTGAMVMQGVNSLVKHIGNRGNGGNKKTKGNIQSGSDDSRIRLAENRSSNIGTEDEGNYMDNVLGSEAQLLEESDQEKENKETNNIKTDNFDDLGGNEYTLSKNGIYLPNSVANKEQKDVSNLSNINNPESKVEDMPDLKNKISYNSFDLSTSTGKRKKLSKSKYIGSVGRLYGPKLGKTIAKAGVAAIGAGTLGMVGVAAGLVSDDYSNVLKYGAAGLTGGMIGGNVIAENAINAPKKIVDSVGSWTKNQKDEIIREAYKNNPKEYKEYLNEKSDREFLNNKEIKQKYIEAFGEEDSKKIMQKAIKYREHGITDNDIIIKAMKQKSKSLGIEVDDDRRIVSAKLASKIDNEKDMENTIKRLKERGIPEKTIKEQEKILRNMKNMY